MELLKIVLPSLKKITVNEITLYENGDKIAAIEKDGNFIYAQNFINADGQKSEQIVMYFPKESKCMYVTDVEINRIFVIPKNENFKVIENEKMYPESLKFLPKCVYEVIDYGILDKPSYKMAFINNDVINISLRNYSGEHVEVKFIISQKQVCGLGPYNGKIDGAYSFYPIGTRDCNGNYSL